MVAAANYTRAGAWAWDDRNCSEKHIFMCRIMCGWRATCVVFCLLAVVLVWWPVVVAGSWMGGKVAALAAFKPACLHN